MRKDRFSSNSTMKQPYGEEEEDWSWGIWNDFKIESEVDSFRLHLGEKTNGSESNKSYQGDNSLDWEHLKGLPFITQDKMLAVEVEDEGCSYRSVGGWWRNASAGRCSSTCLNCLEMALNGFAIEKVKEETLMAMRRRAPQPRTKVRPVADGRNKTTHGPSRRFGSSKDAVDEVSKKLDKFADNVQTWIDRRRESKDRRKNTKKSDVSEATTMTTDLPEFLGENNVDATSGFPKSTSAATITVTNTPTPITFDDVNFDSFDDEDYTTNDENGSGSSSKKDVVFNVENFWDWG